MTSNYFYIVILYYYTHNKYLNFLDIFNDDRRTKVSMKFSMLLGRNTSLKMLGRGGSLDPSQCPDWPGSNLGFSS